MQNEYLNSTHMTNRFQRQIKNEKKKKKRSNALKFQYFDSLNKLAIKYFYFCFPEKCKLKSRSTKNIVENDSDGHPINTDTDRQINRWTSIQTDTDRQIHA